jgi:hypothetical protein
MDGISIILEELKRIKEGWSKELIEKVKNIKENK